MKIAFYKSPKTWLDKGIRFFSKSPYSHCEIILGEYAYSSSGRDGGKRRKSISGMNLKDRSKWDVYNVNLGDIDKEKLEERLNELHEDIPNCGYDFASVILYHMLRIPFNNKKKYICSEYCYW